MDISLIDSKKFKIKTKNASLSTGEKFVITRSDGTTFDVTGPGEYEVGGISIVGTKRAFIVEADGLRVCVLLEDASKLTEKDIEEIGSVDITIVPTSGDTKAFVELARQTDPWVMIPDNFNPTAFLKEMGVSDFNPVPKYTISRDKLPQDLQVVCLK